ncbi:hypothetical protein [Pseudodesulfovibrio sp. zrk46]|uniref:hypothetical protein n=1 Tax=Pseudodesulfovibrio sp. zrk46 TaxID=2725288 RepID=UPI0014496259|nr:hypothetical protein [Pseudodesulfovibrio sp. zrk46]QJB55783.1 hypothetical protein HFN16_04910 [Pseudodesulfovibrio sp. zrk46]
MTVSINFTAKSAYVIAEPEGNIFSHEEMTAYAKNIIAGAAKLRRKKILIRGQDITIKLSMYDSIEFANTMDKISLALQGYRLAVITGEQSAESRSKIETSLVNRSIEFKVFSTESSALQWL